MPFKIFHDSEAIQTLTHKAPVVIFFLCFWISAVYLSIDPSIHPSIYPSTHPSVCLSLRKHVLYLKSMALEVRPELKILALPLIPLVNLEKPISPFLA